MNVLATTNEFCINHFYSALTCILNPSGNSTGYVDRALASRKLFFTRVTSKLPEKPEKTNLFLYALFTSTVLFILYIFI